MILTGELAPGDRLPPEGILAANLGLSRTSLREAVRALTLLGVIDTRQGDGSYITSLGPSCCLGPSGWRSISSARTPCPTLSRYDASSSPRRPRWPPAGSPSRRFSDSAPTSRPSSATSTPGARRARLGVPPRHRAGAGNEPLLALLDGLPRRRCGCGSGGGFRPRGPRPHPARAPGHRRRAWSADPALAHAAATVHVAGLERWVRPRARLEPVAARAVHGRPSRRRDDLQQIGLRKSTRKAARTLRPQLMTGIPDDLRRPTPDWLSAAKLGFDFIRGPYSVPAWAEPSGALGAVPEERVVQAQRACRAGIQTRSGSPAPPLRRHQPPRLPRERLRRLPRPVDRRRSSTRGLGQAALAEAGAPLYVVPTTKHHDGVALWHAPGTRHAEHGSTAVRGAI